MASSYNATSGRYDPSKIQPKFRDCAFASDKNINYFAQWTKLISGIILNNMEGDLSHEIRRGEVKILNNMEGDLSHEIRDVSTASLQSDLYPDCMIKHILETLDVEDDNLETLDVEDDNLKTLDTVKGDNIKTLVSI